MYKKFSQRFKRFFGKKKISKSIQPEIIEAHKLYEEYKLDLALQALNKLSQDQIEGLPIEIQLQFHTFKGRILVTMENWRDALTSAEKSCEIASKFKKFHDSIEKIDSFLLIAEILGRTGEYGKSSEIIKDVDKLIINLPDKLDKLKKEKRAEKLNIRQGLNLRTGKVEGMKKAFEELHRIYSELGDLHKLARNYSYKGWVFYFSGNMDEALNNLNESKKVFFKNRSFSFF